MRSLVNPSGQRVDGTDRLYLTEGLPTLIVWGDKDPVLPVGPARRAAPRRDAAGRAAALKKE